MNCMVLENTETYVTAKSADAESRIRALQQSGRPMTLMLSQRAPDDLIRAASYNAKNTLHIFLKVSGEPWAASALATAGRCGIRSAVTLYPIIPGAIRCVDVLEKIAALSVNYKTTFLFMFPRILLSAEQTGCGWNIGGRDVPAEYISEIGGGLYPSYKYIQQFMQRVHEYMDCTTHTCGMCGRDCRLCRHEESA